jgi:putative intracellular protease/amidase
MPPPLKLAVVLFNRADLLDFLGPVEQLGFLQDSYSNTDMKTDRITLSIEYLGPTRDPIKPDRGPTVLVDRAYDEVGEDEHFDILLIPGGM